MKRLLLVTLGLLAALVLALFVGHQVRADQAAAASASAAWSSLMNRDDLAHLPVVDEEALDAGADSAPEPNRP